MEEPACLVEVNSKGWYGIFDLDPSKSCGYSPCMRPFDGRFEPRKQQHIWKWKCAGKADYVTAITAVLETVKQDLNG